MRFSAYCFCDSLNLSVGSVRKVWSTEIAWKFTGYDGVIHAVSVSGGADEIQSVPGTSDTDIEERYNSALLGKTRDACIFDNGCIVFYNFTEIEEAGWITKLQPFGDRYLQLLNKRLF
jgi:uncharacterized Rmd1/YagE family protein